MMSNNKFTTDVSARLDLLLTKYLQAKRVELHPIECPPWRNHGRQTVAQDQVSCNTAFDARQASRESPVYSYGIRHFD